MQSFSLKFLALFLLIFISLACAKREEAPQIISTEKPEAAPTTIISNQPPREGGTVIMATAPGATPAPSVPTSPPGPTIPAPTSANQSPVTAAAVSATVPIAPPPPPVAVEIKTTSTTEKVGLLECDTYVDRYSRCLTRNVPTDQRGPLVQSLEANIRRWQGMMSSAPGRTDAGNECQRAFDQTKQAMTAYGCVWE